MEAMEEEADMLGDGNIVSSPMEVLLESDEEEASLLEEMEQRETNILSRLDIGSHSDNDNLSLPNRLLHEYKNRSTNAPMENEPKTAEEELYLNLNHPGRSHSDTDNLSLPNRLLHEYKNRSTNALMDNEPKTAEEELNLNLNHQGSGTLNKDEAQILHLDISENDLMVAKSAFNVPSQSNNVQDASPTTTASNPMNLDDLKGPVMGEHGVFSQGNRTYPPTGTNIRIMERGAHRYRGMRGRPKGSTGKAPIISVPRQSKRGRVRRVRGRPRVVSSKDLPPLKSTRGRKTYNVVRANPKPPLKTPHSELPKVFFGCHFCQAQFPLTQASIPAIVKHMNPAVRYNQMLEIPKRLSSYRENIKLGVLMAKDQSEVQVQVVSRLECSKCNKQFVFNVETSENLIIHNYSCKEPALNSKATLCIFCDETLFKVFVRKHLLHNAKKKCKKVDMLSLQFMSSVCEKYAERFKPICVVCNEREWPHKGQRTELRPVCEACRNIIIGGNTTKLMQRDVTSCAICGLYCAFRFVTYWPTKIESLFIGETCISKLESPHPEFSDDATSLQASKVQTLLERALSSFTVEGDDQGTSRLAPHIFQKHNGNDFPTYQHKRRKKITIEDLFASSMKRGKIGKEEEDKVRFPSAPNKTPDQRRLEEEIELLYRLAEAPPVIEMEDFKAKDTVTNENTPVVWTGCSKSNDVNAYESTPAVDVDLRTKGRVNENTLATDAEVSKSEGMNASENVLVFNVKNSRSENAETPLPPKCSLSPLRHPSREGKKSTVVRILDKPLQAALKHTEKTSPPKQFIAYCNKFVRVDLPPTPGMEGSHPNVRVRSKSKDGEIKIVIGGDKESDTTASPPRPVKVMVHQQPVVKDSIANPRAIKQDMPQRSLLKDDHLKAKALSTCKDSDFRVVRVGTQKRPALKDSSSDLVVKVVKCRLESDTNRPSLVPSQPKVFKTHMKRYRSPPPPGIVSKPVCRTTADGEKSKYVIRYVTGSENKNKKPVVINTSSITTSMHSPAKNPRLTEVTKMQRDVCQNSFLPQECVKDNDDIIQLIPVKKQPTVVTLD